jgi:Raf kinase inhibitor-like YbhB/YbcL family protein
MTNARLSNSAAALALSCACVLALGACGSEKTTALPPTITTVPGASRTTTTTVARATTSVPTRAALTIASSAFANNDSIPPQYTCTGAGDTPPLVWSGFPAKAKGAALVVHDPDAPIAGGFTHWVVVNLPARAGTAPPLPGGAKELVPWRPPCPPSGTHHYRFTIYALPTATAPTSKNAIEKAAIARATLVGTYGK